MNNSSLVFCTLCGALLDPPTRVEDRSVPCGICHNEIPASEFENRVVITHSRLDAFPEKPSQLISKMLDSTDSASGDRSHKGATINEKCAKCGHHELVFHTAQLRSADEGQTVFYNCPKCGYKYSVNS